MFFHVFPDFDNFGLFHGVWLGVFDVFLSFDTVVFSGFSEVPK